MVGGERLESTQGWYGGATPHPHRGTGACGAGSAPGRGVLDGQPGAPLGVPHQRGARLRVIRKSSGVGGCAEQRHEPQSLLGGDGQPAVHGEHVLVAAVLLGVDGRPTHHLGPPSRDVLPVLLGDHTTEDRSQQRVPLHLVVERVQPAPDRLRPADPLVDARCLVHAPRLGRLHRCVVSRRSLALAPQPPGVAERRVVRRATTGGRAAGEHRWSSSERSERSDETRCRTPRSRGNPVLVPGGCGPLIAAVVEAFVVPGGVGLRAVVGSAQRREIGGTGLARWSAVFHG